MRQTLAILFITLVVVPWASFHFGTPLTEEQKSILQTMLYSVAAAIAYCFLVGEFTGNNSQVDKLWSVLPIYYVWHITALGHYHPRMVWMSVLVTAWGARLTYNFARRGAYQWKFWAGEEDYRWAILRKRPGLNKRWVWTLFNFGFISTYQNALIFLFTLPILSALSPNAPREITLLDWVLGGLLLLAVFLEWLADEQQYRFQSEKHRRLKTGEPLEGYAQGFVSTGLWAWMRHPNYTMEQTVWLLFYGFSVVATGQWINASMPGALLLLILFRGSSDFSEAISAEKYPAYREYQAQVPRFFPRLWGKRGFQVSTGATR